MKTLAGVALVLLLTPMGWAGLLCFALTLWAASVFLRALGC